MSSKSLLLVAAIVGTLVAVSASASFKAATPAHPYKVTKDGQWTQVTFNEQYNYRYRINTASKTLDGVLTLAQNCWAGVGTSSNGEMSGALTFVIGSQNDPNGVSFYTRNFTAPAGHAPPVRQQDQGAMTSTSVGFEGTYTQFNFTTTDVYITAESGLIWAYCANPGETSLQYHGANHGDAPSALLSA